MTHKTPEAPKKARHLATTSFIIAMGLITGLTGCNDSSQQSSQTTSSQPPSTNTPVVSTEPASNLAVSTATTPKTEDKPQTLQNVFATVHKDKNCGCCDDWIEHAEQYGMSTQISHPDNMTAIKKQHGVPDDMYSCHTTVTESGYVFEGHIPAKYVADFLANPPSDAIGLAVPGMPVGSPGMEYQDKFLPYDIMQINKDGSTQVYASVQTPDEQI